MKKRLKISVRLSLKVLRARGAYMNRQEQRRERGREEREREREREREIEREREVCMKQVFLGVMTSYKFVY